MADTGMDVFDKGVGDQAMILQGVMVDDLLK